MVVLYSMEDQFHCVTNIAKNISKNVRTLNCSQILNDLFSNGVLMESGPEEYDPLEIWIPHRRIHQN